MARARARVRVRGGTGVGGERQDVCKDVTAAVDEG